MLLSEISWCCYTCRFAANTDEFPVVSSKISSSVLYNVENLMPLFNYHMHSLWSRRHGDCQSYKSYNIGSICLTLFPYQRHKRCILFSTRRQRNASINNKRDRVPSGSRDIPVCWTQLTFWTISSNAKPRWKPSRAETTFTQPLLFDSLSLYLSLCSHNMQASYSYKAFVTNKHVITSVVNLHETVIHKHCNVAWLEDRVSYIIGLEN